MSIKDFDFNRPEIIEYEFKPLRNTFIFKTKFPEIPPNKDTLEYVFDCLKPYLKALNYPILDMDNIISNITYHEIVNYKPHIYLFWDTEKTIYLTFRHRRGLISDITFHNPSFAKIEEEIPAEINEILEVEEVVWEEIIGETVEVSPIIKNIMDSETSKDVQIPVFPPNFNLEAKKFQENSLTGLDPPLVKNIFQEITSKKLPNKYAQTIRYG